MTLMHPHRVDEIHDTLQPFGIARPDEHIDNAIQSAIEALTADLGYRPNPDTTRGWWDIEPHAYRFLDLEQDERGRVYELEGAL